MTIEFLDEDESVSTTPTQPSTRRIVFAGEEDVVPTAPAPTGTSFSQEVSQLGPAFKESLGRPLENMGEGFEVVGFQGVANALKGAITEPENYVSAAERFMEPQPGESQFLGFAWQYAPRAAVEQTGQALAAIGGRIAGAAAGGLVAGPPGAIAGGFVGPAIIGAAQVIGPVAKERARNNGRETPNNQDLAAATLTAIGSGALDAIGARYLPGGDKATGKFFKRVASSFLGEAATEAPQAITEQIGSTAGTEAGLNINVKQAIGEGLIGGTTGAGISAITYPLTKDPERQVIRTPEQAEEINIDAKANEEAINLMGQPGDEKRSELITKINEIEKVVANNETLINGLEPNDDTRKQLELENRLVKQEGERLKAELQNTVGLQPVEQRQIELARGLAEPAAVTEEAAVAVTPTEAQVAEAPAVTPAPAAERVVPITEPTEAVEDIEAGAPPLSTENLYFENNLAQRAWRIAAGFKYDKERGDWFHPSYPDLSRGNAEQEINDTNPPTQTQVRAVLDQLRQKYTPAIKEVAPTEVATFQKGDMVRVPNRVPVYEKGEVVGGRTVMVGGSVTRVMPDGKVEVRLQQGGYATLLPAQIEMRKKAPTPVTTPPVTEAVTPAPVTPAPAEAPAITPAPVAETPAVAPAPEAAPIQRDVTRLEQMTPDEWNATQLAPLKKPSKQAMSKAVKYISDAIGRAQASWDLDRRTGTVNPKLPYPISTSLRIIRQNAQISGKENKLYNKEVDLASALSEIQNAGDMAFEFVGGDPIAFFATKTGADIEVIRAYFNQKDEYTQDTEKQRQAIDRAFQDATPVSAAAVEAYGITLPKGYTKQGDLYVYQPTPAAPAAEPAGISVGNRVKTKTTPQSFVVEEVLPQSEREVELGEQYYRIKNERTGEVQTVEANDIKPIKISTATKKMAPVRVEEKATPVPEADRYTFDEAGIRAIEFFGGKAPDGLLIVNDTTNPNYEMKAGYDPETGDIILNRAYIKKGESIEDILTHELGHYIYSDSKFQADFKNFLESMPDDTRAEIEAIINQSYNKETGQTQIEERQVMAFTALVKANKDTLSKWETIKNTIKRWINKIFGTNIKLSDEGAMAVFNVGFKRFKSGERIIRAMEEGTLRTAPEGMSQMDRDYLAAVERGDMETAQRMVDEAAKKAGYEIGPVYHGRRTNWTIPNLKAGKIEGDVEAIYFTDNEKLAEEYSFTRFGPRGTKLIQEQEKAEKTLTEILGVTDFSNYHGRLWDNYLLQLNELNISKEEYKRGLNAIETLEEAEQYSNAQDGSPNIVGAFLSYNNKSEVNANRLPMSMINVVVAEKIAAGADLVVVNDAVDPSFEGGNITPSKIYVVSGNEAQIKSADPVTYDDAGNVIPLSQRFRPTSPDIRRMAAEPRKPAPEKPTAEAEAEPMERGTLARMAITAFKTTPKGILAKTTKIIKDSVFDGDSEISDAVTNRAWTLINNLVATNEKSVANAEAINQLTREAMTEVKAPEGATSEEVKTFEVVKQTVGMPKLRNELFKYAIKLTGQGDKRMLDYLLNNELNLAGSSIKTKEDIGRFLGALRGISSYIITATEAEQTGFFNIAAQQFFNTKNPTPEQVQQIKDIFNKVKQVKIDQEKELMTELEDVGKAAGVDLPNIVQKELDTAPGLDPMVVAIQNLLRMGGTFTYRPTKNKIGEAVKRTITQGITNYRKKMVTKAATGLETGFWKTLASTEDKPGPLGELDAAQNRALGNIVKQSLVAMGLKGTPPDTKMTIYEQVASILGEKPLSKDKIEMADEKIRGGIEAKRQAELENATEDQQDAINLKYDEMLIAWDDAMSRSLDMPVSDTMLRRLILNELKDTDSSIQEIAKLMDEEPAIGTSRQDRLVNGIIEKIVGSDRYVTWITAQGKPEADYTKLKNYLSDLLENMVRSRQEKNKAAKAVAKVRKEAAGTIESQAEKAENTAVAQIERFAKIQSDTLAWPKKGEIDPVLEAIRRALKLDSTKTKDFVNNWKPGFINELKNLGVKDASASILASVVGRQIEVNSMNKQLKLQQNEVELQTQRIQNEAKAEIEKLAKVQSDTLSFPEKKAMSGIRAAVRAALSLQLNLGFTPEQTAKIKANWKGAFVADPNKKGIPTSFMLEMQRLGVEEPVANTLADIVWRQIEVNAMSRQMDATTKAVEAGPIGGIVQAILDTPLANQQDPEWRKNVIIDYLKNAGVKPSQAENIAKLFDLSLRKRFAKAQEEAAIKAAKSIKGGLTTNSRRALEKFLKAIRAQVLDPGKDVAKAFGEQMGWKGFTKEQIVRLNELDAIVNDNETSETERFVATEQIQQIIDQVSAPPSVKEVFSSFYVGNALGRFTTFAVQAFDPLAFTAFNTAVRSVKNVTNPSEFIAAWADLGRAVSNFARETAFSFKNDVLRSGRMIDYLDNQDRKIKRLWDEAERKWKRGDISGAMKDGLFGYTAWTFRTLRALDDGAYSLLTTTTLPQYAEAALKKAGIPAKKRRGVMRQVLEAREIHIKQLMDKGMSRNDATVYANELMQGALTKELSGLGIDSQEVVDSAINDALSRIGKTRFMEDVLTGKTDEIKDLGFFSSWFLRWYENVSKSVNQQGGSEAQKIFYRVLMGFPLIPARIFNIAAGYTPLTIYRHALKNRYSLTYGTALQRRQRLVEQMAGTMALLPLLLLRSNSMDEEEEKKKGFGLYITGQGPSRTKGRELHAQWNGAHKPFSLELKIGGKTKFAVDAKSSGPLSVMIYTLGALDDWELNRKIDGMKTTDDDWRDAQEKASIFSAMYDLAGYFALTTARRGPTTGVLQGLVDFRRYPDDPIAAIAAETSFSALPAVPVLGTGVAKNLSDFFSQPIDNRTKEGAILSNIPIIGPVAGQPALNAYGQRMGELRFSEKLKKSFGVPFTLVTSDSEDNVKLTSITLKQGDAPNQLRREDIENALQDAISDEEWRTAAEAYGKRNRERVLGQYETLFNMKPDKFAKKMTDFSAEAEKSAIKAVKDKRAKNP